MAECKIYLFAENVQRVSSTSSTIGAKIYDVSTWQNSEDKSSGFIPNTPASSTVVNTALVQNNLASYIISNILVNRYNGNNPSGSIASFSTGSAGETGMKATADAWIAAFNGNTAQTSILINSEVTTNKIADSAVTSIKIADSAVTSDKININAVTTNKILNGAVTSDKLSSDSVITVKIANNNVTSAKIADKAVITSKLNTGAVTTDKINDKAVTSVKIADNTITDNQISTTASISSSKINFSSGINFSGSSSSGWSIYANGSVLEFKYGGSIKFKIDSSGNVYTT